ncbi:MAG: DMT family transporter [Phycisphaerae bacterium]|nr:DMT family transporter [Phycisphaerae bacterium]
MPQPKPLKLYSAVTLAMICFSLSFVWFKVANVAYGPLTIVLFRLGISASIILVFTKTTKSLRLPDKQDLKTLLLLAFFEPFLYFMGESYGLRFLSPTVGAVIIATIPLVAPFAAYAFHQEKVTVRHMLGILISFAGVTLVIYQVGMGVTASPVGVALQFSAVFSAVGYTVVLPRISSRMNNISIIFFQGLIGAIYFLPFWLVFEARAYFNAPFDAHAMMAILKLALFASTVAFIFFIYSIRHLGVTKSNMFINMIPVFTALFAWKILGDAITPQKLIGIAIVISGLFFAQMNITKKSKGPDPIPRT